MRPLLLLAAAVAMAGAPALAQTSPPPAADSGTPSNFLSFADAPFRGPERFQDSRQCFNGRRIAGVNRSGERILFVQTPKGAIFRLQLADRCEGLNAAEKIDVRARGGGLVCAERPALVVSKTPAGVQRCRVDDVRRLTATEVAALAASARR